MNRAVDDFLNTAIGCRERVDADEEHLFFTPGVLRGDVSANGGVINITFIYPTGGREAIEYAMRLLQGEKIAEKQIILPYKRIDESNCDQYLTP